MGAHDETAPGGLAEGQTDPCPQTEIDCSSEQHPNHANGIHVGTYLRNITTVVLESSVANGCSCGEIVF